MVEYFDIAVLVIVAIFAGFGFWFGLIHTIGSLIGTVVGAYVASRYYDVMADWLISVTGWEGNYTKVIMFIVAFILINRLVGFGFWLIERFTSLFTRLPFISSLNHLGGLVLGAFEGIVTVGLIIYFVERFPLSEKLMSMIAESWTAPIVTKVSAIFLPLLPDALKLLKSTVDYVEQILT